MTRMQTSTLKWWLSGSLLLLIFQAGAVQSDALIKPFQAGYQLSRNGLPFGRVEVRFQLDRQGRYHYSAKTRPNKLTALLHNQSVTEISQGRLDRDQLIPQHYSYRKDSSDGSRTIRLSFDWQQRRVTTHTNGSPWSMPIPLGGQDKLSQQLAIQIALIEGHDSISFDVADGGRLKQYHYKKEETEKLQTPLGKLTTIRVKRSKQSSADYTIWFAPSLNYLPVRFERKQPDGVFAMKLLEVQR